MRPIAFTTTLLCALLLPTALARASGGWTWPVRGEVLTEFRNGSDPYAAGQHRGVDISAPVGTRVVAATAGTVQYAGVVGSSGLTVAERTADGRYALSYLHLSALSVRRGDRVVAGSPLGAVGVSGRRSVQQPHLHFGVREAADRHAYIDPLRFLAPLPTDKPAPRPVPVPVPAPAPAAADPAPAAVPALAPVVATAVAPVPGHSLAPAPGHALDGVTAPGGATQAAPAHGAATQPGSAPLATGTTSPGAGGLGLRASHPAQGAEPQRGGGTAHAGLHAVAHGPAAPVAHRGASAARADAARMGATGPRHGGGIDTGWLAACLGLVAAATLLARPGSSGGRRGAGRAAFGTLLKAASRG